MVDAETSNWLNVVACKYTSERLLLWQRLTQCHVAVMPSRHEGFGLVGWEAISASIPLIVSKNSGLYQQLVEDELHELVMPLTIFGQAESHRKQSISHLVQQLDTIYRNYGEWSNNADLLLKKLQDKRYTWENTARSLLSGCEISLDALSSLSPKDRLVEFFLSRWKPSDSQVRSFLKIDSSKQNDTIRLPASSGIVVYLESPDKIQPHLPAHLAQCEEIKGRPVIFISSLAEDVTWKIFNEFQEDIHNYNSFADICAHAKHLTQKHSPVFVLNAKNWRHTRCHVTVQHLIQWHRFEEAGNSLVIFRMSHVPEEADKHGWRVASDPEYETWANGFKRKIGSLQCGPQKILSQLALTAYGLTVADLGLCTRPEDRRFISSWLDELIQWGLLEQQGLRVTLRDGLSSLVLNVFPVKEQEARAELARTLEHITATPVLAENGLEGALSALEWVQQAARTGRQRLANRAFDYLHKHLRPILFFKFGKYEECLAALNCFFVDEHNTLFLSGNGRVMQYYRFLAYVLFNLGNSSKSMEYINLYINLCKDSNRLFEQSSGHGVMALVKYNVGDFESAKYHLERREETANEKRKTLAPTSDLYKECLLSLAVAYRSLCKLHIAMGRWEEARDYLQKSKNVYGTANDKSGLVTCFIYEGYIEMYEMNDISTSLSCLRNAEEILKETENNTRRDARDVMRLYIAFSENSFQLGQFNLSANHANTALSLNKKHPCVDMKLDALNCLAKSQILLGEVDEAIGIAREAFILSLQCDYRHKAAESLLCLGMAYSSNNKNYARKLLDKARTIACENSISNSPKVLLNRIYSAQNALI